MARTTKVVGSISLLVLSVVGVALNVNFFITLIFIGTAVLGLHFLIVFTDGLAGRSQKGGCNNDHC